MVAYRIPPICGGKSVSATTRVASLRYVVQRPGDTGRVQERVQESDRAATLFENGVVDERHHTRDGGARSAGAGHGFDLPIHEDLKALRLGGDVGERAPRGVEQAGIGIFKTLEVRADRVGLVRRPGKYVGEAARRERDGNLGAETSRTADGGHAAV